MNDFAAEIAKTAEEAAVTWARQGKRGLDFSQDSLETVEEMLSEAAAFIAEMDEEQVRYLVQSMGCYILEVARRSFGGKYYWYDQRDQPVLVVGEPGFKIAILTWDRVKLRLAGDPADNIPFFYQGFAERVRKAKTGDDALYV
jgi:hypothetical protein